MPKEVFDNQIETKNVITHVPQPSRLQDIDTEDTILDDFNIITDNGESSRAVTELNNFSGISMTRNSLYEAIDDMCEDARIAAAVDIYTSVACEPNDRGHIVWAESDDERINGYINYLLDSFNVDKFAYQWMCSLVKYGDLYLRLYRESEDVNVKRNNEKTTLNEDVIIKAFKDDDKYIEYTEMHKNPAEVFELQKRGKTVGYIRTHLPDTATTNNDYLYSNSFLSRYTFNTHDVDIYPADSFVHACLVDPNIKYTEEVVLGDSNIEGSSVTYTVRRGRSLLYDAYKIWKTLSLLENAILLNRITKSSIVKVVQVDTGDMDKTRIRPYLQQLRQSIENKIAIDVNNNMTEGATYSPIENLIFVPKHDGKNVIDVSEIGTGEVKPQLDDLDYFRKKLFSALGIPGAYLGEDDGESGFDSGVNLTLKSAQFAKKIKRLQNALVQALTDAINLILLDNKMYSYINEFTIKMQAPMTREEQSRKENLSTTIAAIDSQMRLLSDNGIEDPAAKLNILKILLADAGINSDILGIVQKEIDKLEEQAAPAEEADSGDGGGGLGDLDLGGGDFDLGDTGDAEPVDLDMGEEPAEEGEAEPVDLEAPAEEGFQQSRGERVLNERNDLPSWNELGVSYNEVRPQ